MNYMISELFPGRNFCDVYRGRERRERTKKITEPLITLFPFKWTENLQESASDEARGIRWVATPRPWACDTTQWQQKVGEADKHDRRRTLPTSLLQRQIWRKHRLLNIRIHQSRFPVHRNLRCDWCTLLLSIWAWGKIIFFVSCKFPLHHKFTTNYFIFFSSCWKRRLYWMPKAKLLLLFGARILLRQKII